MNGTPAATPVTVMPHTLTPCRTGIAGVRYQRSVHCDRTKAAGGIPWHAMETIGLVLVIAGLGVLGAAIVALRRLRGSWRPPRHRRNELAGQMNALPPELAKGLGIGARHVITVELLNLFELAHKESAFTRPFTALTPRLLRDVVHRKLVGRVRESLGGRRRGGRAGAASWLNGACVVNIG